jgi:predicted ABC-class ATPase
MGELSTTHDVRMQLEDVIVKEKRKNKSLSDAVELEKKRAEGFQHMIKQLQANIVLKENEFVEMKKQLRAAQRRSAVDAGGGGGVSETGGKGSSSATRDEDDDKV